jgi:hypothetical protein
MLTDSSFAYGYYSSEDPLGWEHRFLPPPSAGPSQDRPTPPHIGQLPRLDGPYGRYVCLAIKPNTLFTKTQKVRPSILLIRRPLSNWTGRSKEFLGSSPTSMVNDSGQPLRGMIKNPYWDPLYEQMLLTPPVALGVTSDNVKIAIEYSPARQGCQWTGRPVGHTGPHEVDQIGAPLALVG